MATVVYVQTAKRPSLVFETPKARKTGLTFVFLGARRSPPSTPRSQVG